MPNEHNTTPETPQPDSNSSVADGVPVPSETPTPARETETFGFGTAIEYIKSGHKVCRVGWNGKGMWVALSGTELRPARVPSENLWSPHSRAAAESLGGSIEVLPAIIMKTADSKIAMGWLASQADLLSDDWMIAE